jgi:hypothetical protein
MLSPKMVLDWDFPACALVWFCRLGSDSHVECALKRYITAHVQGSDWNHEPGEQDDRGTVLELLALPGHRLPTLTRSAEPVKLDEGSHEVP